MRNPAIEKALEALKTMTMEELIAANQMGYIMSEVFVRMMMSNLHPSQQPACLAIALGVIHASFANEVCEADADGPFVTNEDRMAVFHEMYRITYEDGVKILSLAKQQNPVEGKGGIH